MPRGILLLEGADAAGKTTLANVYREQYGAKYLHGVVYRDPLAAHRAALRVARRLAEEEHLVVIDRNFISHLVYGHIFKNLAYDGDAARNLDNDWRLLRAVTVLCVPSDPLRQEQDWRRDKAAGKPEAFESVREAITLYLDLARGNLANPTPGYLGDLIRYQDFSDRQDVLLYDRYSWAGRPEVYAKKALHYLAMHQKAVG
jgi:thymidylate kinase